MTTKKDDFEKLIGELQTDFKTARVMRANDPSLRVTYHETGVRAFDDLAGGIPNGRMIEVYGPERCGKSTLALAMSSTYERVLYMDADRKFDARYAARFLQQHQLDGGGFAVVQPESLEGAFDLLIRASSIPDALLLVDTFPALVSQKEIEAKADKTADVARLAQVASRKLPIIVARLARSGASLVLFNQIRDKIGALPYTNPWTQPGGHQPKALASLRIAMADGRKLKHEKLGTWGTSIAFLVEKSSISRSLVRSEMLYVHDAGFVESELELDHRNRLLALAGARQVTLDKPLQLEPPFDMANPLEGETYE